MINARTLTACWVMVKGDKEAPSDCFTNVQAVKLKAWQGNFNR